MKIYSFGKEENPVIMLLPGTCCHWRGNFEGVIPLLEKDFRVLCVSYDGFDETEPDETFTSMLDETLKIEGYIIARCGGHIRAAYGCSLGGSFVGLLAARQNIRLDYGILGSSDLDQAAPLPAKLMTEALMPVIYPLIRDGKFSSGFMNRRMAKSIAEQPEYMGAFMRMFGGARPYVSAASCKNQFYSDMVTPLPDKIDTPTEIHIFYALKMGAKYRERYLKHFAHPVIHEHDLLHEELLCVYPQKWVELVKQICIKPKEL